MDQLAISAGRKIWNFIASWPFIAGLGVGGIGGAVTIRVVDKKKMDKALGEIDARVNQAIEIRLRAGAEIPRPVARDESLQPVTK